MGCKCHHGVAVGDDGQLPFWLELLKDFALCVVADSSRLDKAVQVELLCPEHGHFGGV